MSEQKEHMKVEVLPSPAAVAQRAASVIAAAARAGVDERGRFTLAVSGGHTPGQMLWALANEDVPWTRMYVVQVDERVAPVGDPDRNLTSLSASLLSSAPLHREQVGVIPVEMDDLTAAAAQYTKTLEKLAGSPPILDLVHLGLGADGHTASLVPRDGVLNITDADVGISEVYQGRRRLTLTYPILNRARQILWVVTGDTKAEMLVRLCAGDTRIPAGQVSANHALVLADQAAAGLLEVSHTKR